MPNPNTKGTNEIDIAAIKPRRLDGMAYVCYMLAKDIVTGSRTVAQTDLADLSLISPGTLWRYRPPCSSRATG